MKLIKESISSHSEREGEARQAMPAEGATQAPVIGQPFYGQTCASGSYLVYIMYARSIALMMELSPTRQFDPIFC